MQRREALLAMLSTAVFAGAGCSGGSGRRRIAVVPKGTSHDFWKSVQYGAHQAGDEHGVEIVWQGTTDEKDNLGQQKIVDTLIAEQVDGICLAPINKTTAGQLITSAGRQEIPIVIFDSGVREEDEQHIVSYVATNNYNGGQIAGERLAEVMNKQGGVILLRYQAGSDSTEQREQGFLDTIKQYDQMRLVSQSQRIDSSVAKAQKVSESLLSSHLDEVQGVFTVCEPNNKGMYLALSTFIEQGDIKPGEIKFVAFDSDPRMIEGLKNGRVHGVVLQNPVKMGYDAVTAMVRHLDGQDVKPRIETGETLATPDNMDDPEIAKLLKPKQYAG